MIELARAAAGTLRDGETIAIDAQMNRLALRIAAATLFSADVDDDADTIGAAVTVAMAAFPASLGPFAELLDHVPFHPATRRFGAARGGLDAVIYRLIEERRRDGVDRGDLLSMLLSSRDEAGAPMPDALVRDEALTLLLAGHETTANALTWTWDALARNPAAEARLHAELDAVLGDRDPVPDDVARLPYTRDVIAESMRLRPPAWIVGRRVIRPLRLGAWDVPPGPWSWPRRSSRTATRGCGRSPRRSGPSAGRTARRRPAEVRLLPVRRREPDLHRRELRLDGGGPRARDPRAARPLRRASIRRRSRSTPWSPCDPGGRC